MSYEDGMPAGGNSRFRGYPARMSERQQLALLLQMTSQDNATPGSSRSDNSSSQNSRSSPLQHQRGSKSRWSNKNGESNSSSSTRGKEERVRQMLLNGFNPNSRDQIGCSSPEESGIGGGSGGGDSPTPTTLSSKESTAITLTSTPSSTEQGKTHHHLYQQQQYNCYHQPTSGASPLVVSETLSSTEESGISTEIRKSPPQNKVDRSAGSHSGNFPKRLTLRLNQGRSSKDEKKGSSSGSSTRPSGLTLHIQNQMDPSSKSLPNISKGICSGNVPNMSLCNSSGGSNNSSSDSGDVYEFKSSKEATPVRGSSNSPNPSLGDSKEARESGMSKFSSQSSGDNVAILADRSSHTSLSNVVGVNAPSSAVSDRQGMISISSTVDELSAATPSLTKRAFESNESPDDQEDDVKKKKRKEFSESGSSKETGKGSSSGRVTLDRNVLGNVDKCSKSAKQLVGSGGAIIGGFSSGKVLGSAPNNGSSSATDRKSPSSVLTANSPKPSSGILVMSTTSKISNAPMTPESDEEDNRSRSSDLAPKVPPLKIVIPQTLEQEQGNRNGKNPLNRGHQLPYVVASASSNDTGDKDPSQSASGTTSPVESTTVNTSSGSAKVGEEKKDFSSMLEKRTSTDHQRVLRSSHRSSASAGNGNGANNLVKEERPSGNGSSASFLNLSPLSNLNTSVTIDQSNNSSPLQHSRHHSPTPEVSTAAASVGSTEPTGKLSNQDLSSSSNNGSSTKLASTSEKMEKIEIKKELNDFSEVVGIKKENNDSLSSSTNSGSVDLHPRKRKMKSNKDSQQTTAIAIPNEVAETISTGPEIHPHDQPITNCVQLFLNIRKQIERRRKGLFPVQPKPPQGFKDYLMNRCTYVLAGNANKEPTINVPANLPSSMKDLYTEQERERHQLRMQHVVEKEKLVLSVEQEILRVHGRAARALANQSVPFSVCTILKDEEVYNVITPEQEEKDRNARSRYNGRLFLSWLQDVDDKWEKIKESMLLRHHNEAESLHAVQRMDWEWKLKEVGLCEFKATPKIEDVHVTMVHVSDDFDLLPP